MNTLRSFSFFPSGVSTKTFSCLSRAYGGMREHSEDAQSSRVGRARTRRSFRDCVRESNCRHDLLGPHGSPPVTR